MKGCHLVMWLIYLNMGPYCLQVRNEFEHLLDDDTDMAQMYLTDKLATLQTEGLVPEDEIDDAYAFLSGDHM